MTGVPVLRWLNGPPQHRVGLSYFQRAIGLAILFRIATEARFAPYLWGPHSVSTHTVTATFGPLLGGPADRLFASDKGTYVILALLALGAMGMLMQRVTRLATFVAWLAFTCIGARTPELADGGDNLTALALLYMIALLPAGHAAAPGSLRAWFHNLAALAVCVQVCIVYFVAGFMKMHGNTWHNGTALYVISQVEWFSLPSTRALFTNPLIVTVASYSTMLFQVWFPLALFSRFKLYFLALAMFFHAGIAVTMGLLTFSLVMAGGDLCLIDDDEYSSLKSRLTLPAW